VEEASEVIIIPAGKKEPAQREKPGIYSDRK